MIVGYCTVDDAEWSGHGHICAEKVVYSNLYALCAVLYIHDSILYCKFSGLVFNVYISKRTKSVLNSEVHIYGSLSL